ncbi:MAG: hypothetical protein NTY19_24335 [Planctomycetota bacterium]|nr:hypothetical protein [Planctomycetota bacterium]
MNKTSTPSVTSSILADALTAGASSVCDDLLKKNLSLAERHLVVRADGWHVFADDATPFKDQSGYFMIDWRNL